MDVLGGEFVGNNIQYGASYIVQICRHIHCY